MYCEVILVILFIILYKIIYYDIIEEFKPDETQFMVCSDTNNYNESTNYKLKENALQSPPKGFYSSLLNMFHSRDYNKYYSAPICEYRHDFPENYFDANRTHYIDRFMTPAQKSNYYLQESILDNRQLPDPMVKYPHPKEIEFSVEYQEDYLKKQFLDAHKKNDREYSQRKYS